ncbi:phosphatidylinositol N-acetylglucosaminyltransferase subunit gpi1 [Thoreauomyces humboldtii]|nr:phosphatidylinositol N-acetylglucosaminyltransferase subunit gpi1 [Thoreauomyces humboldtii]
MTTSAIVTVFHSDQLLDLRTKQIPSYLIGWSTRTEASGFSICVAGAIPLHRADVLKKLVGLHRLSIVGTCNCAEPDEVAVREKEKGVLVFTSIREGKLWPSSHPDSSFHIITFSCPNSSSLQYFSLEPLLFDISTAGDVKPATKEDHHRWERTGFSAAGLDEQVVVWNDVLEKINSCNDISRTLRSVLGEQASFTPGHFVLAVSILSRYLGTASRFLSGPIYAILIILRSAAMLVVWVMNARFPGWLFQGTSLKDISATAQQIDIRLQQACFWPQQYILWRASRHRLSALALARYIGFYNTVWLVANDVIVGLAFGVALMENAPFLAASIEIFITEYTIATARNMVAWLMGSPAGLKLNAELNTFLGETFLYLLYLWSGWTSFLLPNLATVIYTTGVAGACGISMTVSLYADLVSLVTLHLHLCYVVASKLYFWQVRAIVALFTLFRGKKHNAEKNRIDSVEYTLDQLLLGTILFTLLVFLFPTVAVYYVLFSIIRLSIVLVQAVLEIVLAVVNHFPLFAITLRIKDPKRVPAGITLTTVVSSSGEPLLSSHIVRLRLDNAPLGLSAIFYQYHFLLTRLRTNYLLSEILASLFTGRNIQTIPTLQTPLGIDGVPVVCTAEDLLRFAAPAGQTCGAYLTTFFTYAPGYLTNPDETGTCNYCPFANGNEYVETFSWDFGHRWRNFGIFSCYWAFNIGVCVFLTYLFRKPKR